VERIDSHSNRGADPVNSRASNDKKKEKVNKTEIRQMEDEDADDCNGDDIIMINMGMT
jgi:hypothetical protein